MHNGFEGKIQKTIFHFSHEFGKIIVTKQHSPQEAGQTQLSEVFNPWQAFL